MAAGRDVGEQAAVFGWGDERCPSLDILVEELQQLKGENPHRRVFWWRPCLPGASPYMPGGGASP